MGWRVGVTTTFPVPVDPKYAEPTSDSPYITGAWHDQAHLTVESAEPATEFTLYTVLWPERGPQPRSARTSIQSPGTLTIERPDGQTGVLTLSDTSLVLK